MLQGHGVREHSNVVGGSNAYRRLNCPASLRMEQRAPEQASGQAAEEGTALHEVMEALLDGAITPDDAVGRQYNGIVITEAHLGECIVPAWEAFNEYLDRIEEADGGAADLIIEASVEFPNVDGAYGHADIIGRTPKRSFVLDWKFGYNAVAAKGNSQGRFYAAAAAHSFPTLFNLNGDHRVDLVIIQPRGAGIDIDEVTMSDIYDFRADLIDAIAEATEDPKPTMTKGPWCKFAACAAICPLHGAQAVEAAEIVEKGFPAPADAGANDAEIAEWISMVLAVADEVEPFFKDVRSMARDMLDREIEVPGWALGKARASYDWADEKAAERALRKRGLKVKDFTETKFVSPHKAKLAIKAAGGEPLTEKEEARLIINKSEGKMTMVRADSGRELVEPLSASLRRSLSQLKNTLPDHRTDSD